MKDNINTKKYWEHRFSSGDWEINQGRWQTKSFAEGQVPHFKIDNNFQGSILDFGCGLGDALPVYKKHFPLAKLYGVDISNSAIKQCQEKYDSIATFTQGDHKSIPKVDIIIASNVLEHLNDDINIAKQLLKKCNFLYITVPYNESPLIPEHVNQYDEGYYSELKNYQFVKFPCIGWSTYGIYKLWYKVYFKNILRFLAGRPLRNRNLQIMFKFKNNSK